MTPLFSNPLLNQQYGQDPGLAYSQGLMQQGASTAPVLSWGEALARALQGGVGGFTQSRINKRYQGQDDRYRAGLAKALQGGDVLQALQDSGDPSLQQMGLEMRLKTAQAKQQAQIEGEQKISTETAMNPIMAQRAGLTAQATAPIEIGTAIAKAQALLPIETQRALGIAQGQAGIDIEKAKAMAPIETAKAVATAQALLPLDVQKALNIAQVTAPVEAQKQKDVFDATTGPQQQQANIEKLRDDYRQDPNVKNYQTVQPIIESMRQASKTDTRAADLNLVYGIAKIMDPGSVVREGEQVLVQDTGALGDRLTNIISAVNGGQRLTDQTRKELMAEADSRVAQLKGVYDYAQKFYGNNAAAIGAKPEDVFYDLPAPKFDVINYDSQGNPL